MQYFQSNERFNIQDKFVRNIEFGFISAALVQISWLYGIFSTKSNEVEYTVQYT